MMDSMNYPLASIAIAPFASPAPTQALAELTEQERGLALRFIRAMQNGDQSTQYLTLKSMSAEGLSLLLEGITQYAESRLGASLRGDTGPSNYPF